MSTPPLPATGTSAPATPAAAVIACGVCGTPTVPGARYCFACGALLDAGGLEADARAERRVVTVLFADLSDFTAWAEDLDPERVGGVTSRLLEALTATVTDVGGYVDKLTGDGLMAVFGAPVAHEDDPERAVRAAARMQQEVRRLVADEAGGGRMLGLRVGLNTGVVLAGIQASRSYTVVGDTVNTASRLSDAASVGTVYAGRDTALATLPVASWRALPPLRLKGKRAPVPAYELLGLRTTSGPRLGVGEEAPLIGREAELGALVDRLLDAVDRGVPSVTLIVGEAGVGKTRLARELTRFVRELPDARVLWSRCRPYGEERDLAPILDVVRTAVGLESDGASVGRDVAERVRRLVAHLADSAYAGPPPAALADRLLTLLGLAERPSAVPADAVTPGVPPGDPMLDAVGRLLTALAAQGPVLLVVDDLQWASDSLLDALDAVADVLAGPVVVLGLARAELLERRPEQWRSLPHAELLPLVRLDEAAMKRLLAAYLGGTAGRHAAGTRLDPEARVALLARAAGNPFFLAELLHLLVERGVLRPEDRQQGGGWVLAGELPAEVLPAGVHAVLAARIDGLDPGDKDVLRAAALVGSRFDIATLGALVDPAALPAALDRLIERGLLERRPGGSYAFAHTMAREVAYSGVPKTDRAHGHAAVVEWALAQREGVASPWPSRRPAPYDDLVAGQGERAVVLAQEMRLPRADPVWKVRTETVAAQGRTGCSALDTGDSTGARSLLDRAVRLATDPAFGPPLPSEVVLPLRLDRARALLELRALSAAEAELPALLASDQPELRAAALVISSDLHRKAGRVRAATEAAVSAVAVASEVGLDRITAEALRQLGLLAYFAGQLRVAEQRFRQAHDLARQVGDARGAGWALQHLAWAATTRGDYDLADETLDQAADVFAELEDTAGLAWCVGTEGFVRLLQGRLSEARELASSPIALGRALGERWGVAACLLIDAYAAAELGEVTVGRTQARDALAVLREVGDTWGECLALMALAVVERDAGDPDAAVRLVDEALRVAERGRHRQNLCFGLVIRGFAELDCAGCPGADRARHLAAAAAAAERAADILDGLDLAPAATLAARVLQAQVQRAQGDVDGAVAALTALLASSDGQTMLFPLRQVRAHLAGSLLQAGHVVAAVEAAREAVATPAEDVRSRVIALRALGSALAAAGDQDAAVMTYRQAQQLAEATEQRSEVAATERALARLAT